MVIWFNVKKAFDFLLVSGQVYTLRPKKRSCGLHHVMSRHTKEKGKKFYTNERVFLTFRREIHSGKDLRPLEVRTSGFRSASEWFKEASKNGTNINLFLYYAQLCPKPLPRK